MHVVTPAKSRRARLWKVVAFLLLVAAFIVFGIPADRRYRRAMLIKELMKAGGVPTESETGLSVRFGRNIRVDRELLQSYDYFDELEFQELVIESPELTPEDVEELFRAHPLESVCAPGEAISPSEFSGLKDSTTLRRLSIQSTGLNDEALATLPLESIESLNITNTPVTPRGLAALKRCAHLSELSITGSLFTDEVVVILQSVPLRRLDLSGPETTDEHVRRLDQLTGRMFVNLHRTSASAEAIDELMRAKPVFFDPRSAIPKFDP